MKRAALAILLLLLAICLGLLTIRFQRIFMEYAVNVCEDSAIKEINTLMEDEVFSHPDEFADLVVLERDSDNRITALRTDIIAVGKVKARIVNGLFDRLDYLEETQTEVPLGTVPERYAYIGGSGSDLLGEIRDYEENSDISHETGK